MVEPDENYVKSMLSMGFADAALIRRALVIAKNDLNVAVGLLTDDTANMDLYEDAEMRDTETQHGSDEGEMDIPSLDNITKDTEEGDVFEDSSGEPPPYDEVVNTEDKENKDNLESGPLEFPTTHLYELEGRVFGESWSIPFKREESLGKCLIYSARFAQEGKVS